MYKSAYAVVLTVVDTQMATAKPWQQARLQILQEQLESGVTQFMHIVYAHLFNCA